MDVSLRYVCTSAWVGLAWVLDIGSKRADMSERHSTGRHIDDRRAGRFSCVRRHGCGCRPPSFVGVCAPACCNLATHSLIVLFSVGFSYCAACVHCCVGRSRSMRWCWFMSHSSPPPPRLLLLLLLLPMNIHYRWPLFGSFFKNSLPAREFSKASQRVIPSLLPTRLSLE